MPTEQASYGLGNEAVRKISERFAAYPDIESVILYGSRAKGAHRPGSDIDLTIKGPLDFSHFLQLENELDDLLLPWMIDLSLYRQIENPDLLDHIKRVGKVFYQK